MGFYLNPPADGFAEILRDGLYMDKSELIGYMNHCDFILISITMD